MSKITPQPIRVILLFLLIFCMLSQTGITQNTQAIGTGISINIPDEQEQNGLIRGFWHDFSISTTSNIVGVELTSNVPHNAKNESNHYIWSYNNGLWLDELYNLVYVDSANCLKTPDSIKFRLGVDVNANLGTWLVTVTGDSQVIYNGTIVVSSSLREYSLSAPDYFIIGIENSTAWISPSTNQYFRLENTGNVPLGKIDFSFLDNIGVNRDVNFQVTNDTPILHIDDESMHYISFKSDESMNAQDVMLIDCTVKATASYVIPTTSSHLLESILAHKFTITVYIKNAASDMVDVSNFLVYEYQEFVEIRAEEEMQHEIYITALRDTILMFGVTSTNIEITQIEYAGVVQSPPVNLSLSSGEKICFTVNAISYQENSTAKLIYGITPANGRTDILQINLDVGNKAQPATRTWLIAIAAVFVGLIITLGIISILKKNAIAKSKKNRKKGVKWKPK